MSAGKQDQLRLGFLTAIEVPEKGYVGGLLVTTHHGRPLEFQCTLPVKPNSTQEILYGPTLGAFILGELLAGALVDKAGIKPHIVLTDREAILELRNHIESPVALVSEAPAKSAETPDTELRIGRQVLRFHEAHSRDKQALEVESKRLPNDADLREPFQRVREALQETLRLGALREGGR
jgi:hypothetical protein